MNNQTKAKRGRKPLPVNERKIEVKNRSKVIAEKNS